MCPLKAKEGLRNQHKWTQIMGSNAISSALNLSWKEGAQKGRSSSFFDKKIPDSLRFPVFLALIRYLGKTLGFPGGIFIYNTHPKTWVYLPYDKSLIFVLHLRDFSTKATTTFKLGWQLIYLRKKGWCPQFFFFSWTFVKLRKTQAFPSNSVFDDKDFSGVWKWHCYF